MDFIIGIEYLNSLATVQIVCLAVALTLALAFEFVNGFHDTANAVVTVIYTHSLPPSVAVIWSGLWNLAGVLTLPVCVFLGAMFFAAGLRLISLIL
jgi:PiT family inorganic phosphate transporter